MYLSTRELVSKLPGPIEIRVPDIPGVDLEAIKINTVSASTITTPNGEAVDVLMIPVSIAAPLIDKAIKARFGFGIVKIYRMYKLARMIWNAVRKLR